MLSRTELTMDFVHNLHGGLLSRESADSIPFSSAYLPSILAHYSNTNTTCIKKTLGECEAQALRHVARVHGRQRTGQQWRQQGIRVYRVSAVAEDGTAVEATAICHNVIVGLDAYGTKLEAEKSFCHRITLFVAQIKN
ncbi:uncharacterized protein A4U43_C01F2030 [Asparagus officinalis]|uniref:BURP domain-containing protein n=1 Tax=Asparagus officinalis TaxID=4686 RepID=A0A5P1FLB3_ASPOF|nr:uncharacterized protein A4U43_C01F2030 [Asparagus officinalis]